MYGCEIVWPWARASAASSYACERSSSGTNSSRGTRRIASSTRSSVTPRRTSCRTTQSRDSEMLRHEPLHPGDRGGRRSEADRQHRHLGVEPLERAVTAAAEMVATREIEELPARRGGDDHLSRVRIAQ